MRSRLLLLGVLGVLTTLSVGAVATISLDRVSTLNSDLAQVNSALHHHQIVDEMHDALRADVARAQLAGSQGSGVAAADVAEETDRHATRFHENLKSMHGLRLPPRIRTDLEELRPVQHTYIVAAESLVASALDNRGPAPVARTSYEAAFQQLVPSQARVTRGLVAASDRLERAAHAEEAAAQRKIGTATVVAIAIWVALLTWHLRSLRRLRGALSREAEQRAAAELLQRSLLPTHLPSPPGVQLVARTVPGSVRHHVGGDWYDALTLPSGQLCLVVGDVVGHDLPAATAMGQLRSILRAYALEDASPDRILRRLNRAAYLLDSADLATCICAVVDPLSGHITWSSAGHPPPLLSSGPRGGRLLPGEPGAPLAATPDAEYPRHETWLQPGETLLMYTDGLVERRGKPIDVGLRALQKIPLAEKDAADMCEHLLETLVSREIGLEDDVTMLLVQADAAPHPPEPPAESPDASEADAPEGALRR